MRVEDAKATDGSFQRKGFSFELDLVLARDVGPHINFGGGHLVGMAELEDDFRIADRKAVDVSNAPPQNEGVVVEAEVRRIHEDDLANIRAAADFGIGDEANLQAP